MRLVIQRVTRARVRVDGETVGEIGAGALLLLGVLEGDDEEVCDRLAARVARYRFFADETGRVNLSVLDLDHDAAFLVVSQFTLAADGKRGRRPSFDRAAPPALARPLVDRFVAALEGHGVRCATGRFGAHMEVELVNDGPVTLLLEELPRTRN
ncbi:MAG TPA: D-tyrosyl-tRNA(Tyr) deacylase [Planctomycetes bacterium]|nr:D-tyrosyl-tRNA(Tyr) deacylase [Planctomycetota bacterium]